MDYIETIKVDMYAAMKSGDKDKAGALRTLFAKLKDKQINTRKDLTEKECISVIKTLVKQRQESIEMYEKAGREGLAVKEKLEFDIIELHKTKPELSQHQIARRLGTNAMKVNRTLKKQESE